MQIMQEFHGVFPYLVSPIAPDGTVLEAELRRLVEAVASYDQAIALNPQIPEVWSNRGNALQALGRPALYLCRAVDQARLQIHLL